MAGEAKRTQTAYIGAPIDGINLIAPPNQMAPTEARQLDNYFTFDHGIRQRVDGAFIKDFGGGGAGLTLMVPFIRMDGANIGNEALLVSAASKIWRYNSKTDTAPTDLGTIDGGNYIHHVIFGDYIFLFNGTNLPIRYQLSTGTLSASGFTGPPLGGNAARLQQATTYKNRIYAVERSSTKFWYAGVGAITGPMVSFDLAQVFQRGGTIAILVSWSPNQGIGAEEMLVAISTLGEVLVYSGDYPVATNWQLAGRTQIPKPVGDQYTNRAYVCVAQDVYVVTMRGVIPLSRVFSGNTDDRYYIVSHKLGDNMGLGFGSNTTPAYDSSNPFLYFVGEKGKSLFVLNYERGGWSRFVYWNTILPFGDAFAIRIGAIAVAFGCLWLGTAVTESKLYRYDDFNRDDTDGAGADPYVWKTPFLGFDSGFVKQTKYVRVVARDLRFSAIRNTVSVAVDFKNTDGTSSVDHPSADSAMTVAPTDGPLETLGYDWVTQELRPPGNGKTISYVFARVGQGELNELSGFECMTETGGGAY